MIIVIPGMGNFSRIGLSDLARRLEVEYRLPDITTRTIELGARFSPEFACLPLKVLVGSFIEGFAMGGDKGVFPGGDGPCRFGYYTETIDTILRNVFNIEDPDVARLFEEYNTNLDYFLEAHKDGHFMHPLGTPRADGLRYFTRAFQAMAPHKNSLEIWIDIRNAFRKAQAVDRIEREVAKNRCFEIRKGDTDRALAKALEIVDNARHRLRIIEAERKALAVIEAVPKDKDRDVLKVALIGEFYMLLEPSVNFDIEKMLGKMGVSVTRTCFPTDWIVGPKSKNPVYGYPKPYIAEKAKPYLNHPVGGEGESSIGNTRICAEKGFDGIIHLGPFTCMPETIAKAIFPRISREEDIPILSFTIDEQTGRAGIETRIEAQSDLMWARRKGKKINSKELFEEPGNCSSSCEKIL